MEIGSSPAGSVAGSVRGRLLDTAGRRLRDLTHFDNNIEALKKEIQKLVLAKERLLKKVDATKRNCSRLFDAAGRELGYLLHYDNNIEALKGDIQKLALAKERLLKNIDAGKGNCQDIFFDFDVQVWIAEVEEISAATQMFLDNEVSASKWCSRGWCIHPRQRYQFSKEAKKQTLAISDQLEEAGKFENALLPSPVPPPEIIISPSMGFSGTFESRESVKEEIMDILLSENVRRIGICGMGGVGRTTLVKEIAKEAKESMLYREVVTEVVSKTRELTGREHHLLLNKQNMNVFRTSTILKKQEVLTILEIVGRVIYWDYLKYLIEVKFEDCKILITSRSKNVCDKMNCEKIVTVGPLSKQESWELFKEIAGPDVENSNINSTARDVAVKCGGLPLAIVTVARALKKKEKRWWTDAVKQLRKSSPTNIEGMQGSVVSALELSQLSRK